MLLLMFDWVYEMEAKECKVQDILTETKSLLFLLISVLTVGR